jgi:putative transposase
MSRVPRIQVEDAIYYIVPAGNHDEPIFKNDEDYAFYLGLLARYKSKRDFKLFAFCLTPNSINLLMAPANNATISQIMHDLNPNYTKYFNGKYNRAGRLFQERYRIVLIEKAPNILKMTAYIHLRPKLLRLTDDISSYKYTSFLTYLNEERRKSGTEVLGITGDTYKNVHVPVIPDKPNMIPEAAYVLGYLKDKSYQQFVDDMGAGEVEELNKALEKEKVIGSADFQKEVWSKIESEREAPAAAVQSMPIEKPPAPVQPMPIEEPPVPARLILIEKPSTPPPPIPIEEPPAPAQPAPIEEPPAPVRPIPIEEPPASPKPMLIEEPSAPAQPVPTQTPKATSRPKSNIWIFTIAICLVILSLACSAFFAYTSIQRLKESVKQQLAGKDIESQNRLAKELDAASKDLSKTYEAKLASNQAVLERLEADKRKAEDGLRKTGDELRKAKNELSKAKLSLRLRDGARRSKKALPPSPL